jgi:hypothetical protein
MNKIEQCGVDRERDRYRVLVTELGGVLSIKYTNIFSY